jgi:hypothetical protein
VAGVPVVIGVFYEVEGTLNDLVVLKGKRAENVVFLSKLIEVLRLAVHSHLWLVETSLASLFACFR